MDFSDRVVPIFMLVYTAVHCTVYNVHCTLYTMAKSTRKYRIPAKILQNLHDKCNNVNTLTLILVTPHTPYQSRKIFKNPSSKWPIWC